MAEVFLYVGTLLIAFEIVRDVSHLPTLAIIIWWRLFKSTVGRLDKKIKNCPIKVMRVILGIAIRIVMSPIFVLTFAIAAVIIVIWLGGTIIVMINNIVNIIYRKELKETQKIEAPIMSKVLNFFAPGVDDKTMQSAIEKINIRFMAIIGVIFITVGFILRFVNT